MRQSFLLQWLWFMCSVLFPLQVGQAQNVNGVVVKLESYDGSAQVAGELIQKHKLRIDVDPQSETKELLIRVELPVVGREAWPVEDVEVRDARGDLVVVRHPGIEWQKLLIPVKAVKARYFVQAAESLSARWALTSENERQLTDATTGLTVSISRWYDGRRAALSLRFDDSHPSHLTTAIPILREYGFRGTFMINPGEDEPGSRRRSSFQMHRDGWEQVAKSGDQEFANHSAHHRGATSDDDMDAEIGDAARAIWKLVPGKSKLMALNLGGGTVWSTSRTLRYYLDKYHQFDASSGSLGMDDSYGNRVNAFREKIEQHIERGLWCKTHFHYIGDGLSSSEANFRAALEIAKSHEDSLWIAGMADIYKYQTERNSTSLSLAKSTDRELIFRLSCQTDPELYDQRLTIEITPTSFNPSDQIAVRDSQGKDVSVRTVQVGEQSVFRLDVPPHTSEYAVQLKR